jgi:hypothetical protein
MIDCIVCAGWYHHGCAKISDREWETYQQDGDDLPCTCNGCATGDARHLLDVEEDPDTEDTHHGVLEDADCEHIPLSEGVTGYSSEVCPSCRVFITV